MDEKEALIEVNKYYQELLRTISKEDFNYLIDRDTLKGKLLGFLEGRYYKRKRLLKEGEVVLGYAFQEYDPEEEAPYKAVWVLHSPSLEIKENPNRLKEVALKLMEAKGDASLKDPFLKKIKGELYQGFYIEVPSTYAGDSLVYLSVPYLKKERLSDFHLGFNFFIANMGISKDLWFLPARFIPFEIYKGYLTGFSKENAPEGVSN